MAGRTRGATAVVLIGLLTFACTEPALEEAPSDPSGTEASPDALSTPERDRELLAALELMVETLTAIEDRLQAAAAEADPARARAAAEEALALLVGDEDADAMPLPLLPATESERSETAGTRDVLTATLTLARDSTGTLGTSTVATLRDPIVGDLGAWERDPAGVIAQAQAAISSTDDLDELEDAVLSLPGEASRALAWTLLASRGSSSADIQAYAERGVAHLNIMLIALSDLAAEPDGGAGT